MKIELVDFMGSDLTVVNSARVSYGVHKTELDDRDIKLIKYLADHQHLTPFEHCSVTFRIQCPIYIARHIMRHRTLIFNEISRRYTSENLTYYTPEVFRKQNKKSKQCSDGSVENEIDFRSKIIYQNIINDCEKAYQNLIDMGVARELARGILPQTLNTEFYMTGNLRNLVHFLKLRLDDHAQFEAQYIAQEIKNILDKTFPNSVKFLLGENKYSSHP